MESTFIAINISNHVWGVIYLIMNLMFLVGAAFLAIKSGRKSLTVVSAGWFLLSINMLVIWINPSINPVTDFRLLYIVSLLGLTLFVVGGVFFVIGTARRYRNERDEARQESEESKDKLISVTKVASRRKEDDRR